MLALWTAIYSVNLTCNFVLDHGLITIIAVHLILVIVWLSDDEAVFEAFLDDASCVQYLDLDVEMEAVEGVRICLLLYGFFQFKSEVLLAGDVLNGLRVVQYCQNVHTFDIIIILQIVLNLILILNVAADEFIWV